MKTETMWFDLEYQINFTDEWKPAWQLATKPAEAIEEFAVNYAPCFGKVTAVRVMN
jgi:hypothetical protein